MEAIQVSSFDSDEDDAAKEWKGSECIGRDLVEGEGSGDKSEVARGSGLGLRLCLPVGTLDVAGLLEL